MSPPGRQRSLGLALAALIAGCAHAAAPPGAHVGSASPLSEPRLVIPAVAVPRSVGADVPVLVCVDPSLDVALVLADSILAGGPGTTASGDRTRDAGLVELALRMRAEAAALRDTLGRLCGEWGRRNAGLRRLRDVEPSALPRRSRE